MCAANIAVQPAGLSVLRILHMAGLSVLWILSIFHLMLCMTRLRAELSILWLLRIVLAGFLLFPVYSINAAAQPATTQPVVSVVAHELDVDEGDPVSFDINVSNVPSSGVDILYWLIQRGDIRYRPAEHIESVHYGRTFLSRDGVATVTFNTVADTFREEDYVFSLGLRSLTVPGSNDGNLVETVCSDSADPFYLVPVLDNCIALTDVIDRGGNPRTGDIASATTYAWVTVPPYIGPGDTFPATFSLTKPAPASGVELTYTMYEKYSDYLPDTLAPEGPRVGRHKIYIPPGQTSVTRRFRTRSTDTDPRECPNKASVRPPGTVSGCIIFGVVGNYSSFDAVGEYETLPAPLDERMRQVLVFEGFLGLSIDDVTVSEDQGPAKFTLSLTKPTFAKVEIDIETMDGTATHPADYTRTVQTVSINPQVRRARVSIPIINDNIAEPDETFQVRILRASGATIIDNTGIGTILDDGDTGVELPEISVNDITVAEHAGPAVFTVSLSRTSTAPVSVNVATSDGSALQPGDYSQTSTTLTFAPGILSRTFSVPIVNDLISEQTETFNVLLDTPVSGRIADNTGVGTITDDDEGTGPNPDPDPQLSINDVTVAEHAGPAVFTVSLSAASTDTVSVNVLTRDGTALEPGDYTAVRTTAIFPPGSTSQQVRVPITDDQVHEPTETFTVQLDTAANAVIADRSGTGTITDNDPEGPAPVPQLSIDDVTVSEDAGPAVFTVSLSQTSTREIRVSATTSDGSAVQPGDYTRTQATVIIPAGTRSMTFPVPVINDSIDEPVETFNVTLTGQVNAAIAKATGIGTITDDDDPPRLSINDVTVAEDAGSAVFTISLSGPSGHDITFNAATRDGSAVQPADYTRTSNSFGLSPGITRETFTVPIIDDAIFEPNEIFSAVLDTAVNAVIAKEIGIGTITDNDLQPLPELSIDDVTVAENAGPAVFTVSLSRASTSEIRVNATTADGSAVQPGDYTRTQATVIIPAGTRSMTVPVPIINDTVNEPVETFTVTLSGPFNAVIADGSGTGTITDDDAAGPAPIPGLSINDIRLTEDAGQAVFTVTLSEISATPVTVNARTMDGSALAPADYTSTTGLVTFPPGTLTQSFRVPVVNDDIAEPDETFTVQLASASGASITDNTGIATIIDDGDSAPQISVNDVTVAENAGPAVFTISLSKASGYTVFVNAATADGTALQPGDYIRTSALATFAPGETRHEFRVPITDDDIPEPNESFTVQLATAVNASIADETGTGIIIDDNDAHPQVLIGDVRLAENAGPAVFAISLSKPSGHNITFSVTTRNGTALHPGDYTHTTTAFGLAPGITTESFEVPIIDDTVFEPEETFTAVLGSPVNVTIADPAGIGTIIDNDLPRLPQLSINDVTVAEEARQAVFTVSLSQASANRVLVNVSTTNGTALQPGDYTRTFTTVSFAPGERMREFTVPIVDDDIAEPTETFTVRLDTPAHATLGRETGIGTITDHDGSGPDILPAILINDVTVAETDGQAVFTLSLSRISTETITVNAATRDGTAIQPGDYTLTSSIVNFAPGTLVQRFSVPIIDDSIAELNEIFTVRLSAVVNAVIADETGLGIITDDDTGGPGPGPRPALSINDVTLAENEGPAMFTISLSRAGTGIITVNATTFDGSARHPDDYTRTSSVITFAPGTVSMAFPVPVIDDDIPEPNETFTVRLAFASGASIADNIGIATITDDGDRTPEISVNDVTVAEDEGPAVFTISLSKPSGHEISLTAATRNGTARAPADYIHTSARVIFPAGTTVHEFPVPITDDTVAEPNENFTVNLAAIINATFADPVGLGRIIDDDDPDDGPGPANAPPVADAGPDQRVYFNETVRLDGSGSYDPDGDIITYAWRSVSPSGPALTAANSVHPGFIAGSTIAIHHFQLTVRDPSGLSSTDTVSIHVVQDPLPLGPPIGEFILDRHRATLNDQPKLIRFLRGVQRGPSDTQQQKQQQPSTPRIIYDAYTYSAGKYGKHIKPKGEFTAVVTPERVTAATEFYRNGFWGEFTGIRSKTRRGSSMHLVGSVGYHRVQSQRFLYGIMAQFQSSDTETVGYTGEISGKGWLAGPYFAARHKSQPLYFEGRFLLGKSSNTVGINEPGKGTRTGRFNTSRWLAQLRMEGNVNLGSRGTRLIPYADIRQIQGEADPFMAATERGTHIRVSGQTVKTGQLEFGSNVEIPIDVQRGEMLFTVGAGIILSRTKGQYIQDSSNHRGRIEAGLQYRLDENVFYEFDAFMDGIAASGYRGYGLSLTGEYKF